MSTVLDAHNAFYAALNANNHGDPVPMRAIWSQESDISDLGPFGPVLVGHEAVLGQFAKEDAMDIGGEVVPVGVHVVTAGDMGFSVCVETVSGMSDDGAVITFRATNIFRLESGEWKMVHHHTDASQALQDEV